MSEVKLGLNSESIAYETAIEVLGQSRAPFMSAIREEKAKTKPSAVFIRYCEMRLAAIDEVQDELEYEDRDTVERILNLNRAANLFATPQPSNRPSPSNIANGSETPPTYRGVDRQNIARFVDQIIRSHQDGSMTFESARGALVAVMLALGSGDLFQARQWYEEGQRVGLPSGSPFHA